MGELWQCPSIVFDKLVGLTISLDDKNIIINIDSSLDLPLGRSVTNTKSKNPAEKFLVPEDL